MGEFAEYMQRLTHSHTASDCFLFDSFMLPHSQPLFPISNSSIPRLFLGSQPNILDHNNCATNNQKSESTTTSFNHISPSVSITSSSSVKPNKCGRGMKGKNKGKEVEKLTDKVIHVRAKRGQATDSHSIAERVRREKINHKLKCLQDIVPGCHKSMGMAVMLEEIINYVHSLQNQVEFLSMELAAASSSYDFNLEKECSEQGQATTIGGGAMEWLRERYEEELSNYQYTTTWSI